MPHLVEEMARNDHRLHQKDAACYEMSLIYRRAWDEAQALWCLQSDGQHYRLTRVI